MPVNDTHKDYDAHAGQWRKVRDCVAGQEAVYAAKTLYLPELTGQTDPEYKAYQQRAPFYGATARTLDGLSGMIFRKPPAVETPDGMTGILEDVTLTGQDLTGFAEQIVDDALAVGRAGILVDHPTVAEGTTRAVAEMMNIRPFMKHYAAENILNWRMETRNNKQVLVQVRLREWAEIPGKDEFDYGMREQIRVLDFNDLGQYRQRVFIKDDKTGEWMQFEPDIIPIKSGAPLNVIPFFFVGVKNSSAAVEKSPLIDLAEVNLSHYRSTADLEHGAHFTGLPTAVITGHSTGETGEEFKIGSATAWIFSNSETKAYFLEFQGQGLEALEKRIAKKEEYMAFLGARMLTPEKRDSEAAETAQIHRTGENSVLSSLSNAVSKSIETALKFVAEWGGFDPAKVSFRLNSDFIAVKMSAQELAALLQTWQAGGMAFGDFLENLKRGEIVREDRQAEDIRSEVEMENPFKDDETVQI